MRSVQKLKTTADEVFQDLNKKSEIGKAETLVNDSWQRVASTWPLKNIIAANPLAGFENIPFEKALQEGQAYFQQADLPHPMCDINRETIKWLQAFFDQGQATIRMPQRHKGLFASVFALLPFDAKLKHCSAKTWEWLSNLPADPYKLIMESLFFLGIPHDKQQHFLTLQLTTLPGWAAYINYRTHWADAGDMASPYRVSKADYLALRLILTCLIWPQAKKILSWHENALKNANTDSLMSKIIREESVYQTDLLKKLSSQTPAVRKKLRHAAQFVFCIDVRSEPFRRTVEQVGNYETFGFAGFFGMPVSIENKVTGEIHASCPVLLKPGYNVVEAPSCNNVSCHNTHQRKTGLKKLYQSLKYSIATPFTLVEALGPFSGLVMVLRNFFPALYSRLHRTTDSIFRFQAQIDTIPLADQIDLAAGALQGMGLTKNFAPLVVFCGHGSETQNNAYATALDCGACGGHHGAPNARILAAILNKKEVVSALCKIGIDIPDDTYFIAAEHNTTSDQVTLYAHDVPQSHVWQVLDLQCDLQDAKMKNSYWRTRSMGKLLVPHKAVQHTARRSQDWAQVRPEWGLARNAAFIVGPRTLTEKLDLQGRTFLHSYEWEQDKDGAILTTILTAPMVVAQWINTQYLFSTLDNVAYGGGSKISKNITGKIGIIQGNASDLMHGLPLQSVYINDNEPYHQPLRLMTVVHAPRDMIDSVVKGQEVLQKLFGNGWVKLACIDPHTGHSYTMASDFSWTRG